MLEPNIEVHLTLDLVYTERRLYSSSCSCYGALMEFDFPDAARAPCSTILEAPKSYPKP